MMSPYTGTIIATTAEKPLVDHYEKLIAPQAEPRKYEIVYKNLVTFGYGHAAALYGLYLAWTTATWSTIIFRKYFHDYLRTSWRSGIAPGCKRNS